MRSAWIVFVAMFMAASAASAQTPVDSLPQGSAIAGWAVEAIQVPEMQGRLERQRSESSVAAFAGQTGVVRKSVAADLFSSAQFDRQKFVFNGRAFLRVQAAQQYVFVVSAIASSLRRQEPCELIMNVGGKAVVVGAFRPISSTLYDVDPFRKTGPAMLSGNVNLQPGFYPVEFVVGCPRSSESIPLEIQFRVREERDAAPRIFANGELIHIQR